MNTYILEIRDVITKEWDFHRHRIQLLIITGVNINSLKVLILELNDCVNICNLAINESFTGEMMILKEQEMTVGV